MKGFHQNDAKHISDGSKLSIPKLQGDSTRSWKTLAEGGVGTSLGILTQLRSRDSAASIFWV